MFSEDRETIERILAGEPEAFEYLVRKYNRMGGAIAFAIVGDFHKAEDVVQESFLKAFRSLRSIREQDKFKFWFAEIVRTRALDAVRQRDAHPASQLPTDLPSDKEGSGAEAGENRRELGIKIREAIAELPEEDRLVVVLKHMEGLSYKEIAELAGTTVSAVESRLFRARQVLRKRLQSETL